MARADTLRRLTSRLISRRNALRRTLSHDLVRLRQLRGGTGVGDEADAAVDSANEELSSQLAEIESRETRPDRARALPDCRGCLRPVRVLRRQDLRDPSRCAAVRHELY